MRLRSKALLAVTLVGILATNVAGQAPEPMEDITGGGWMGLYIRTVDRDDVEALDLDPSARGVVVSGIDDEGPASEAGIEPGDVITGFDGREIRNRRDFMRQLERRAPGDKVSLQVLRDSGEETYDFTLGERPRELTGRRAPRVRSFGSSPRGRTGVTLSFGGPTLGVHTLELKNPALAEYFGVGAQEGVLVTDVIEDSGADAAGIRGGDVILAVDGESVANVGELREILADYAEGEEVQVQVRRQKRDETLRVELSEPSPMAFSGLNIPRVPSRTFSIGDDMGDLRREIRDLKRDIQRLEREMRRR